MNRCNGPISSSPWSRELPLTGLLIAIGLLLRVAYAWANRTITGPDPAVVALMASHMATLQDFPIFFYGQSYMGSLEPAFSAIFVALLGPTGFAVNLGVVSVSFLALLGLAKWGRDAIGRWGGAAAILGALLGPAAYFKFQTAPRGGYMVALAIDAAVLVLAAKIAADLWTTDSVRKRDIAALGLLAGLGIWSNMIVAAALCTAAILVLIGMHGRFWRYWKPIGVAALSVLVGAIPILLHIVKHGFDILNVSRIGSHAPLWIAILNFRTRWLQCQVGDHPAEISSLAIALAILPFLLAALGIWAAWSHRHLMTIRQRFATGGAVLFCVFFLVVYVFSGFPQVNAPRYLIPLVPALALLDGMALTFASRLFFHRLLARALGLLTITLSIILLVLQAMANAPAYSVAESSSKKANAKYAIIAKSLRDSDADAYLAPNPFYPLNFAMQESIPCSDGRQEFCPSIRRAVELATHPAYHRSWFGIKTFLDGIDAPYTRYNGNIIANVRSPRRFLMTELSHLPTCITPLPTSTQTICRIELPSIGSSQLNSTWLLQPFFYSFSDTPLCEWISSISVNAVVNGNKGAPELHNVSPPIPLVPIEWSICRAYYSANLAPEIPFGALPPGTSALQLVLNHKRPVPSSPSWELLDVLVFAGAADTPGTPIDPDLVLSALEDALARHPSIPVFAERYFSTQLFARGQPRNRLPNLPERLFPSDPNHRVAAWEQADSVQFPLDGSSFLVSIENRYRPAMDRLFSSLRIPYEAAPLTPTHQLLHIPAYTPPASPAALSTDTPIPCLLPAAP